MNNSAQIAVITGGVLVLAALFLAAIWNGVVVITASIKVVPPWQRKAPEKRVTTTNSVAGAADEAPVPATVPITERQRGAA